MILQQIALITNLPKEVGKTLRAVAMLIEDESDRSTADIVANTVSEQLEKYFDDKIVQEREKDQRTAQDLRSAAVSLTNTVEEKCGELQAAASQLSEAAEEIAEQRQQRTRATPMLGQSYADAIKKFVPAAPPGHTTVLAKSAIASRQILIDKAPGSDTNSMLKLTERELVEKANIAHDRIMAFEKPDGLNFVGANRLRNGGVVFLLNTERAADWIKENTRDFLDGLGGEFIFKNRTYNIIAEFIPVTFDPTLEGELRHVENLSGLREHSFSDAKYLKPLARRKAGQAVAHMVFSFNTKEAANHVIEYGLIVEGKRVQARKSLTEPL